MKNKDLRITRCTDGVLGILYWKKIPWFVSGGFGIFASSSIAAGGLGLGIAISDGKEKEKENIIRNVLTVSTIIGVGGAISCLCLAMLCGVRGFRHFSRGIKCHKELMARIDKNTDIQH